MTAPSAERLTIYLLQTQRHGRSADYVEIVSRARGAGMAGATVLPGAEGFGASAVPHRRQPVSVVQDVPVKVVVVDSPAAIDRLLRQIAALVAGAVVVRQPVQVLWPRGDAGGGGRR